MDRTCINCKYLARKSYEEPCVSCEPAHNRGKYEPKEEMNTQSQGNETNRM